ncbi:MAG: RNA 2',3'-cyclic phosphodiesterase [Dehalococcoidia bacterium]|nr:RNA 2',3'-cyclic phosphodiesterase [Dehalococcoidia bacterium]
MRAFIAAGLPTEVLEALSRYQRQLGAPRLRYVKWVSTEGMHLTLKFLCNVEDARLPDLAEALNTDLRGIQPFSLQTGALGAFPNVRTPRVLWVGLAGDLEALQVLSGTVEKAVAPLGFLPEERPFAPHLTLGRVRETATSADRRQLGQALASLVAEKALKITVDAVHIIKSDLSPAGARYTKLTTILLAKKNSF